MSAVIMLPSLTTGEEPATLEAGALATGVMSALACVAAISCGGGCKGKGRAAGGQLALPDEELGKTCVVGLSQASEPGEL
jgi:hypothetical protein